MQRSRYSNGSFLFHTPTFSPFDWAPLAGPARIGRIAQFLKPWEPVSASFPSDQLTFIHNTIGDGDWESLEGHGYISSFKSILKFDVIPEENWNALEYFQKEIQFWYSRTRPLAPLWNTMGLWGPYRPTHPPCIESDLLVMVRFNGEFHRGCIVCEVEESPGNSMYYVEILDYGHVALISKEEIFELAQRFASFPVQPIRCCLNLPYHFLHVKESFDDGTDPLTDINSVEQFQQQLVKVGEEEMLNIISLNKSVKIEYAWKNVRKLGEPWMVNIKTGKDSDPESDLVSRIRGKMDPVFESLRSELFPVLT